MRTDVGLVRSENQDFGLYTTPSEEREAHPGGRLMVVADGMGGHRGGATASRLAGEIVKAQYLGSDGDDVAAALRDSLARANARIHSEAASNPDLRGMGTTTSALVVRNQDAWFAHVGDSRIYMVRGGEIKQLTDDHSLVATMVREGLLTKSEAETHPRRNVLQRSMGVSEDVEIDVRGPFEVQVGDIFILCSDGLHGVVKEEEMRDVVAGRTIRDAADEFIRLAIERGAPDNVTVIVARVGRAEDAGEDTVIDRSAEEEEALPTAKMTAFKDEDEVAPTVSEVAGSAGVAPEDVDTAPGLDPVPPEPPRSLAPARDDAAPASDKKLKWMLIVVLLLGAASAWFFWNHSQGFGASSTSSRSR